MSTLPTIVVVEETSRDIHKLEIPQLPQHGASTPDYSIAESIPNVFPDDEDHYHIRNIVSSASGRYVLVKFKNSFRPPYVYDLVTDTSYNLDVVLNNPTSSQWHLEGAAFSKDDQYLAIGYRHTSQENTYLDVVDLTTWSVVYAEVIPKGDATSNYAIRCVEFSNTSNHLFVSKFHITTSDFIEGFRILNTVNWSEVVDQNIEFFFAENAVFSSDDTYLYVSGESYLYKIDTSTWSVVQEVNTPSVWPAKIALNPAGTELTIGFYALANPPEQGHIIHYRTSDLGFDALGGYQKSFSNPILDFAYYTDNLIVIAPDLSSGDGVTPLLFYDRAQNDLIEWEGAASGLPFYPDGVKGMALALPPPPVTFFEQDLAESFGLNDALSMGYFGNIAEALESIDAVDAAFTQNIIELLRAADLITGSTPSITSNLTESVRVRDLIGMGFAVAVIETLEASDIQSPFDLVDHITEALRAHDTLASQQTISATVVLSLLLRDEIALAYQSDHSEALEATDDTTARLRYYIQIVEALAAAERVDLSLLLNVWVNESIDTADELSGLMIISHSITEAVFTQGLITLGDSVYTVHVTNAEGAFATSTHDLPFTSYATFQGRVYGAGDGGVYELTGDTDQGQPIDAAIRWGLSDYGTPLKKRMDVGYLVFSATGVMRLHVIVTEGGEKREYWYEAQPLTADAPREQRVKIGKGLKSLMYQFELVNVDGADFYADSLRVYPIILSRRV